MAKENIATDPRDAISLKMEKEGRTLKWLSKQTGYNYNTLHSCIRRKLFSLSQEMLTKCNKALETDFTL